jgi:antitoxin (DNA-binding transcriptional repressor) of toxin-antitoxin stability system
MRSVGLKILKNKLSEYVRLAAGGETILITDRDRVVVEIVPPQPGRSPLLADAQLAEAVREGWLTPPVLAGSDPPPRKPVMTLRDLMQDLQRDREDRRSTSIARSPWHICSQGTHIHRPALSMRLGSSVRDLILVANGTLIVALARMCIISCVNTHDTE